MVPFDSPLDRIHAFRKQTNSISMVIYNVLRMIVPLGIKETMVAILKHLWRKLTNSLWMVQNFSIARKIRTIMKRTHRY